MKQEQTNMILTKKEYVMWLEMSLASALQTIESMHKDIYYMARKNMQLEDENIATSLALVRNPLRSVKEFHA